jgi:hypothetical protein
MATGVHFLRPLISSPSKLSLSPSGVDFFTFLPTVVSGHLNHPLDRNAGTPETMLHHELPSQVVVLLR